MQKGYWTSEVAEMLGVAVVTVRVWAKKFEELGYTFAIDKHGRRGFVEADVVRFRAYMSFREEGMTRPEAIRASIALSYPDTSLTKKLTNNNTAVDSQKIFYRLDTIEKQYESMRYQFQQQQKWIEERLEQRDQALVATMRTMLEMASSQVKHDDIPWWSRWFKHR